MADGHFCKTFSLAILIHGNECRETASSSQALQELLVLSRKVFRKKLTA